MNEQERKKPDQKRNALIQPPSQSKNENQSLSADDIENLATAGEHTSNLLSVIDVLTKSETRGLGGVIISFGALSTVISMLNTQTNEEATAKGMSFAAETALGYAINQALAGGASAGGTGAVAGGTGAVAGGTGVTGGGAVVGGGSTAGVGMGLLALASTVGYGKVMYEIFRSEPAVRDVFAQEVVKLANKWNIPPEYLRDMDTLYPIMANADRLHRDVKYEELVAAGFPKIEVSNDNGLTQVQNDRLGRLIESNNKGHLKFGLIPQLMEREPAIYEVLVNQGVIPVDKTGYVWMHGKIVPKQVAEALVADEKRNQFNFKQWMFDQYRGNYPKQEDLLLMYQRMSINPSDVTSDELYKQFQASTVDRTPVEPGKGAGHRVDLNRGPATNAGQTQAEIKKYMDDLNRPLVSMAASSMKC